ncbi:5115_t:CDS:2 [Paraglomus occultum]|uniref:5115_t:CDS:1 n=1 Tax=Paraglomus occultum TaxID=144539 RepID=A0A9N9AY96_9GLOM|nr:5115_t:CDS:2 [Paraglomus occultum]
MSAKNFGFGDTNSPIQTSVDLQSQSRIQDFLPSATSSSLFDYVDATPTNSMDYKDGGTYTGNYALYQDNFPEDIHQSNVDTMNVSWIHLFAVKSKPIQMPTIHMFHTPIPTSNEYIIMREERTQSMVGRISAASSVGEMLALTRM